jgi:hypothetical protein
MNKEEIVAAIVHKWMTDRDGDLEQIKALWRDLRGVVDYYDALDMIESRLSTTAFLYFCEVLNL